MSNILLTPLIQCTDTLKGSYYFNPTSDKPEVTEDLMQQHPSYLRDNIWPSQTDCPGFETHVKALARLMTETGCLLAKACDKLVAQHSSVPSVEKMIASSKCSKARLLHYFPPPNQVISLDSSDAKTQSQANSKADSW